MMSENDGCLGKSSFKYKSKKTSAEDSKEIEVLMCDHEVEGEVEVGYFIIAESVDPKGCDNLDDIKVDEGKIMLRIPEPCLERMFCHYESIRRRRQQLGLENERKMQHSRYIPSHPKRY